MTAPTLAGAPLTLQAAQKYQYVGTFDRGIFTKGFTDAFHGSPHYTPDAVPPLLGLLALIEADAEVRDIRWAAYMLATVFWETTSLQREQVPVLKKNGRPLLDRQGKQVMRTRRRWCITMAPVEEIGHGAGRAYYRPVKVTKLPDGSARVIEQDGDTFEITGTGRARPVTRHASMGAPATGPVAAAYDADGGMELSYFGRGYVQLTWWANYARAGAAIGLGLALLFDPDLAKRPDVAYRVMSHGMRTGEGFANGNRLADFFHGASTDYPGARTMVNGTDRKEEIAEIARKFEKLLLETKR